MGGSYMKSNTVMNPMAAASSTYVPPDSFLSPNHFSPLGFGSVDDADGRLSVIYAPDVGGDAKLNLHPVRPNFKPPAPPKGGGGGGGDDRRKERRAEMKMREEKENITLVNGVTAHVGKGEIL